MNGRVKYYDPITKSEFGCKARVCCFSDTHNLHAQLKVPECDVLVCAGDFSSRGESNKVMSFLNWFNDQRAAYKIYVAGNHDVSYQKKLDFKHSMLNAYPRLLYLEDSGAYINGLTFWGSPYQPTFGVGWAFNEPRGEPIRRHWDLIPAETDVLITHGPAYNVLDRVSFSGERVGCEELSAAINRVKPQLYIAGHIHENYGQVKIGSTTFANVSLCDDNYDLVNQPMVFDL